MEVGALSLLEGSILSIIIISNEVWVRAREVAIMDMGGSIHAQDAYMLSLILARVLNSECGVYGVHLLALVGLSTF